MWKLVGPHDPRHVTNSKQFVTEILLVAMEKQFAPRLRKKVHSFPLHAWHWEGSIGMENILEVKRVILVFLQLAMRFLVGNIEAELAERGRCDGACYFGNRD
jgi:hypothetical protein